MEGPPPSHVHHGRALMGEDLYEVVQAVNRVRSEVSSMSSTVIWIGVLILGSLAGGCDPARDPESRVLECRAEAIEHSIEPELLTQTCMGGKGYAFRSDEVSCMYSLPASATDHDCYEKRGYWRSTKVWAKEQWRALVVETH